MEYRFGLGRSAPRGRRCGSLRGRGVLTRSLTFGPPAGGEEATPPDRAGDFSPRLWRRRTFAASLSSRCFREPVLDRSRRRLRRDPGGRRPLNRPRHPSGRQLDGLPSGGATRIMRSFLGWVASISGTHAAGRRSALLSLKSRPSIPAVGRVFTRNDTGLSFRSERPRSARKPRRASDPLLTRGKVCCHALGSNRVVGATFERSFDGLARRRRES
jgi:hypothetical protein